jgi:hypothetical protein
LPSVFVLALDKEGLCRVPEKLHSAKQKTLGKDLFSGSVSWIAENTVVRARMRIVMQKAGKYFHFVQKIFLLSLFLVNQSVGLTVIFNNIIGECPSIAMVVKMFMG